MMGRKSLRGLIASSEYMAQGPVIGYRRYTNGAWEPGTVTSNQDIPHRPISY